MQLQVMNSPFNQEQAELLNRLLPTLTASQKAWLSGYLAAVQTADAAAALETLPAEAPAASPAQPVSKEVTILFGSQTGNAQGLAENAAKTLTERGFQVTVSSMSDFKPNQLKKLKRIVGLDMGTSAVKAVELTDSGGKLEVTGFGQIEVATDDATAKANAVSELMREGGFRTRRVVTSLSGKMVIVRYLAVVRMTDDELKNAIAFEAGKYVPFPRRVRDGLPAHRRRRRPLGAGEHDRAIRGREALAGHRAPVVDAGGGRHARDRGHRRVRAQQRVVAHEPAGSG